MYSDKDLPAPPYDVDMMCETLENSYDFVKMKKLKNYSATKNAILSGISTTFSEAGDDDISYFYFSGHGDLKDNISYLIPTDYNGYVNTCISVNELETALNQIKGIKVVFLDTCHSGGFIGKEMGKKEMSDYGKTFNDNVINVFSAKSYTNKHLGHSPYQVLTSSHSTEYSWEFSPWGPFVNNWGLFSGALCLGCGYPYFEIPYSADYDENGKITLQEAYDFVDYFIWSWANSIQDTQVYPKDSYFIIIEY